MLLLSLPCRTKLLFQYANLYFLTSSREAHFRHDLRQRQLPDPFEFLSRELLSEKESCSQCNRFVHFFFSLFGEQRKRTRKITRVADPVISLLWFSPPLPPLVLRLRSDVCEQGRGTGQTMGLVVERVARLKRIATRGQSQTSQ